MKTTNKDATVLPTKEIKSLALKYMKLAYPRFNERNDIKGTFSLFFKNFLDNVSILHSLDDIITVEEKKNIADCMIKDDFSLEKFKYDKFIEKCEEAIDFDVKNKISNLSDKEKSELKAKIFVGGVEIPYKT